MGKFQIELAHHFWEDGEMAVWRSSEQFPTSLLTWLKKNYLELVTGERPRWIERPEGVVYLFFLDEREVHGRMATRLTAAWSSQKMPYTQGVYAQLLQASNLMSGEQLSLTIHTRGDNTAQSKSNMILSPRGLVTAVALGIVGLGGAYALWSVPNDGNVAKVEDAKVIPEPVASIHEKKAETKVPVWPHHQKKVDSNAARKKQLHELLDKLHGARSFGECARLIEHKWHDDFTQNERRTIKQALQNKYLEIERQRIPKDRNLGSIDDMKKIQTALEHLSREASGVIKKGEGKAAFVFHYQHNQANQQRIKAWNDKMKTYEYALHHGLLGYITFIGNGTNEKKTNPLQFSCSETDHDISMTVDKTMKFHDDEKERTPCLQSAKVSWNIQANLKYGEHDIKVEEKGNVWKPDRSGKWSGEFTLSKDQVFEYVNQGKIDIPLKSTKTHQVGLYTLRLSKDKPLKLK